MGQWLLKGKRPAWQKCAVRGLCWQRWSFWPPSDGFFSPSRRNRESKSNTHCFRVLFFVVVFLQGKGWGMRKEASFCSTSSCVGPGWGTNIAWASLGAKNKVVELHMSSEEDRPFWHCPIWPCFPCLRGTHQNGGFPGFNWHRQEEQSKTSS